MMYKNKLLKWLFAGLFLNLGVVEDGAGGGSDFDIAGAVDAIGDDLFGGSDDDGDGAQGDETGDGGAQTDPAEPTTDPTKQTPIPAPSATDPAAEAPAKLVAPKTWRPEALASWETLPPTVQAEVLKREEDMFKGLEGYKANANVGSGFQQAIAPFQQLLTSQKQDPIQLTHQLMTVHAQLALGSPEQKLATIHQIAQSCGVELYPADPENAPYTDPEVSRLQKQLAAVQSQMSQTEQWRAESEARETAKIRTSLAAEIDAFASDAANLHFDEVANDIAALMNAGLAKDLKDAYEQAIYRNPVTRQKEIERKARETAESAQKAAQEKADKAKKATSVNVRTTAKQARGTAALGSIDDTLAATLASINGREK